MDNTLTPRINPILLKMNRDQLTEHLETNSIEELEQMLNGLLHIHSNN